MADSWTLLDLDDIERRAETGDIDRTDVRALVADVRRKLTGLAAAERERDAANAQAARLVEENRQADGAAIDLAERLDKATAELKQATAESAGWERLAHARAVGLKEAIADRDRMIASRAAAIEKIPALRAKVKAGAALRPEIGAVDDEDAMALLIMAAADVHGLWEREKGRTAELREALNLSRLAAEGWEKRAADAGLMVAQLRAALEAFVSGHPNTLAANTISAILARTDPEHQHFGDNGVCFECGAATDPAAGR